MTGDQDLPDSLQTVLAGAPLEQVVPADRRAIRALVKAGYQFLQQGRLEMARNVFTAITALDPKEYQGYAGLGALEIKESKFREAFYSLRKAAELNTSDPAIFANTGEVLLRLGKQPEAKVLLECAIGLDPSMRNAAANRARAILAGIEEPQEQEQEAADYDGES